MNAPLCKVHRSFVETSRGFLHAQQAGEGEVTLVFISVTSFGGVVMDRVLPQLAALGFRVVALDLMGYGRSDKRTTLWRVEDFADNIEEALAALDAAPDALICGHFSSWTGIEIASRARARLRALVLDGSPLMAAATRAAIKRDGLPAPVCWSDDGKHMLDYWNKARFILKGLNPTLSLDGQPDQRVRESVVALMEAIAFEPGVRHASAEFDIETKLPKVLVPTLVICGEYDWNKPHQRAILAGIRHSRELALPGVHPLHDLVHPERSIQYVTHLEGFLRDALG